MKMPGIQQNYDVVDYLVGDLSIKLAAPKATHKSRFRIGGVSVIVAGACREDVTLIPSLEPFRIETGSSDIRIQIERVPNLPPTHRRKIFDSGTTWRLYQSEDGFQFDFRAPVLGDGPYKRLLADNDFSHTTLQISEESFAGCSFEADPLG